ncbi:helicase HerA domain-containing protein [Spiroplasma endosymbiont of Zeiraphera isertana]|uniref:helicase HerA domain-containing protein n=1 Tax=Spiroplasma endosymbiont of Zeiraphera isertana TaxID=3066313 RepID=UPI00313DF5EC
MNKFEKIVLILFAMFLTFIFLICLINIVVAIAYAGIKLKSVNWNNFSIAFEEDICFNISAIIATLITLIFSSFIFYQKWKNFDMFSYEQKKKEKKIVQEFKKIPPNNLVMLDNKIGLIKSNLTQHTLLIGTTGIGKTTTALSIINQLVYKLNQTVIIIDGKGDDSLINKIKSIDNNAWTVRKSILFIN